MCSFLSKIQHRPKELGDHQMASLHTHTHTHTHTCTHSQHFSIKAFLADCFDCCLNEHDTNNENGIFNKIDTAVLDL